MMFNDSYKTIENACSAEFKDRGSVFSGHVYPVSGESEIKKILNELKQKYPDANHICYAFRLGADHNTFRFSDDREPSGSAGKPIFGVIRSNDLTNVLIAVARTFGGTLLGVPGLINAYRSAADLAIKNGAVIDKPITEQYSIEYDYDVIKEMNVILRQSDVTVLSQMMEEHCSVNVEIQKSAADSFINYIKNHHLLKEKCRIKVLTKE